MQASEGRSVRVFQFGAYELDAQAGELRRSGVRLKLQEQPRRILEILLQHPGEVLSREQLQRELWSEGTFVDYEAALNTAVHKLRIAINDSAEAPRFIETVGRRGYRFVAPVKTAGATEATPAPAPRSRPRAIRVGWRIGATMLAILVLCAAGYLFAHRSPKLSDKDTILLAEFTNKSGDPVFDETLRQGMAVQLSQSPFLSLLSEERTRQVLQLMGKAPDAVLTAETALDLCQRTASAAVLDGSITKVGSEYVLGLRAKNCRTGDVFFQEQRQTASKEDVLNVLGAMATEFRSRVGESLASLKKYDTPLPDATTASLEALKSFSEAKRTLYSTGSAAALPLFKRAVEIDPKFAIAYAWLGRMYGDLGEFELSGESTRRAFELRDRASDVEKFFISASYDLQVTGNLEKARETCEAWKQAYPRDGVPYAMLSGMIYPGLGKYDSGLENAAKTVELDPDFVVAYMISSYEYETVGRFDEAEAVLKQADARKLVMQDTPAQRYDLAFLRGDEAAMRAEANQSYQDAVTEAFLTQHEAFAAVYAGRLQEARRLSKRAMELTHSGQKENAAQFAAAAAVWEAFFGNRVEAKRLSEYALSLSKQRDVEYGAALSLALTGDHVRAQALADDLQKRFPEDSSVTFSYLPVIRAALALQKRQPEAALDVLQTAVPYELGQPRSTQHAFFGAMYPIYFRGEAFLVQGKGADAVAEFEKIRQHPGIIVSDPVGALAQLELARAYALAGDSTKARNAYREFLDIWKTADENLLQLRQAKSEMEKLP